MRAQILDQRGRVVESIYPPLYRFSRRVIARNRCKDCGVNVIEIGDYTGPLQLEIWEGLFGLGWHDNLCIACIEKRLGRELTLADFVSFAYVEGYPPSETLLARLRSFPRGPTPRKKRRTVKPTARPRGEPDAAVLARPRDRRRAARGA